MKIKDVLDLIKVLEVAQVWILEIEKGTTERATSWQHEIGRLILLLRDLKVDNEK